MDDFFKNLKDNKLSDMESVPAPNTPIAPASTTLPESKSKEETVIINNTEESIRRMLEKTENNDMIDVDEISIKLNEITEQSKAALEDLKNQSTKIVDTARIQSNHVIDTARKTYSVLTKSSGFALSEPDVKSEPEPELSAASTPTPAPEPDPAPAPTPERTLADTILAYIP